MARMEAMMNDYVKDVKVIAELMEGADHVDVKIIEGEVSLREFLAGLFSYMPGWLRFLYGVRWGFVRLLGMKQEGLPQAVQVRPEDISFVPGEKASFFAVTVAEEERFWVSDATEAHLVAYLGVVVERLPAGTNRFHFITIVHYRNWAGPIYFNVIRPFHHLVVRQMMKAAVDYTNHTDTSGLMSPA